VPGRGYRFAAPVTRAEPAIPVSAPSLSSDCGIPGTEKRHPAALDAIGEIDRGPRPAAQARHRHWRRIAVSVTGILGIVITLGAILV